MKNSRESFYKEMGFNEWEERYKPVLDSDGDYKTFETYGDDARKLLKESAKLAGSEKNGFLHVWTAIDGEEDSIDFVSGYRRINRLYFLLCKKPFANNEEDGLGTVINVSE